MTANETANERPAGGRPTLGLWERADVPTDRVELAAMGLCWVVAFWFVAAFLFVWLGWELYGRRMAMVSAAATALWPVLFVRLRGPR